MIPFLNASPIATTVAASLLMPQLAAAASADGKRELKIVVCPKPPPKYGPYGFLPGYRQPLPLAEWRDRSPRHGGGDFSVARPPLHLRLRMALRLGLSSILSRTLERGRLRPVLEQYADRPDVELRDVAAALPVTPESAPCPR